MLAEDPKEAAKLEPLELYIVITVCPYKPSSNAHQMHSESTKRPRTGDKQRRWKCVQVEMSLWRNTLDNVFWTTTQD